LLSLFSDDIEMQGMLYAPSPALAISDARYLVKHLWSMANDAEEIKDSTIRLWAHPSAELPKKRFDTAGLGTPIHQETVAAVVTQSIDYGNELNNFTCSSTFCELQKPEPRPEPRPSRSNELASLTDRQWLYVSLALNVILVFAAFHASSAPSCTSLRGTYSTGAIAEIAAAGKCALP
jgi:hypothetical protein